MKTGGTFRLYGKDGGRNIRHRNVSMRSVKFLKDFATTLIEGRWRYTLTIFALSFVGTWTGFALLWQLIAQAHGDLDFDPLTGERLGDGRAACTKGAYDYAGFLLLSIETQGTTGYGEKYPTEECPEGIFLLMLQLILGTIIEGAMVGVVYAKITRPPRHTGSFVFSRNCVICLRDGVLCLLFRISNFAEHQEINSRVEITLYLPQIVCHAITEDSPLFGYSAAQLMTADFEILVTLTGNSKATGQTSQSRTSFLPREILWGYRFVNIIHYDQNLEAYTIDSQQFDGVYRVDTPLCSARRLQEVAEMSQKVVRRRKVKSGSLCCSKYSLQIDMQVAEIALDNSTRIEPKQGVSSQFQAQSWDGFLDSDSKSADNCYL
uniref:Putative inward rectifier potassium channel n=1 Tax=Lutzomyia longipalpis TaxID=7200 RepID=A0A1B0GIE3_LUTLO